MNNSKICKTCHIEKDDENFRSNTRHCIPCVYEKNKLYSKKYYQMHKTRLIEMNKDNYVNKRKALHPKKIGRPTIYEVEKEIILTA